MKKLFLGLVFIGAMMSSTVWAADVVISITIPDAYVARVTAAIEGELMCPDGVGPKACLTQHIISDIKALIKSYESKVSQETFSQEYVTPQID